MSIDQAIALMTGLMEMALWIAGPVLGAALIGGVVIGVLQTATQINEMSVAYVVKAGCVLMVFVLAGSALAAKMLQYTRGQLNAVADVVKNPQ